MELKKKKKKQSAKEYLMYVTFDPLISGGKKENIHVCSYVQQNTQPEISEMSCLQ